jgi:hypothetical protein
MSASTATTSFDRLNSLSPGDTFTAQGLPGEWEIESIEHEAETRNGLTAVAFAPARGEHFALRLNGNRAAQTVTPEEIVDGDADELGILLPATTKISVENRSRPGGEA